jgi:hypothetical protein
MLSLPLLLPGLGPPTHCPYHHLAHPATVPTAAEPTCPLSLPLPGPPSHCPYHCLAHPLLLFTLPSP